MYINPNLWLQRKLLDPVFIEDGMNKESFDELCELSHRKGSILGRGRTMD